MWFVRPGSKTFSPLHCHCFLSEAQHTTKPKKKSWGKRQSHINQMQLKAFPSDLITITPVRVEGKAKTFNILRGISFNEMHHYLFLWGFIRKVVIKKKKLRWVVHGNFLRSLPKQHSKQKEKLFLWCKIQKGEKWVPEINSKAFPFPLQQFKAVPIKRYNVVKSFQSFSRELLWTLCKYLRDKKKNNKNRIMSLRVLLVCSLFVHSIEEIFSQSLQNLPFCRNKESSSLPSFQCNSQ